MKLQTDTSHIQIGPPPCAVIGMLMKVETASQHWSFNKHPFQGLQVWQVYTQVSVRACVCVCVFVLFASRFIFCEPNSRLQPDLSQPVAWSLNHLGQSRPRKTRKLHHSEWL